MSGDTVDAVKELDASSLMEDNGFITTRLNRMKNWFFSQAHNMNFFSILVLASVPNPLFDLAGIICGQFGIPFWEFFLATMIGKAIIKTHIQTLLIISVCNNQLLDWIENELIWVLSLVPGFDSILPNIVASLHSMKDEYLVTKPHAPSNIEAKKWDFSLAFIWNTVVWFVLMNFFVKIVNGTAQGYLKKEQDMETATLQTKLSQPSDDSS